MRRHKFSIRARTRQGQTTPDDAAEAKAKFIGEVRAAIIENEITTVYNVDQTGRMLLAVFFEYLPRKTITKRGKKPCGGKDKAQATVMLLGDWHGNKYAPVSRVQERIFTTGSGSSNKRHFTAWIRDSL
ncbi:hypothetical protein PHMEG_00030768, partial [Phytophthora megakarya]